MAVATAANDNAVVEVEQKKKSKGQKGGDSPQQDALHAGPADAAGPARRS
jgi:hypothetical protein